MDRIGTTLVLVRHGQARAESGAYDEDTPLSALGRRQAEAVAAELAAKGGTAALYTSPFRRAAQTARPISERLGLEAVVDERLAEFSLGPLETLSPQQILQERPDLLFWRPEHVGVEGGETLRDFSTRVAAFCQEAVRKHGGEQVVVVSHAGTTDAVLRWALGLGPDAPWQMECDVSNASITVLKVWPHGRIQGGAPRHAAIGPIGDAAHLGALASDL